MPFAARTSASPRRVARPQGVTRRQRANPDRSWARDTRVVRGSPQLGPRTPGPTASITGAPKSEVSEKSERSSRRIERMSYQLKKLQPKHWKILDLYFEGRTGKEMAKAVGRTRWFLARR